LPMATKEVMYAPVPLSVITCFKHPSCCNDQHDHRNTGYGIT
jgi:hypothetical protein